MNLKTFHEKLSIGENVTIEFKRCGNGIQPDTYESRHVFGGIDGGITPECGGIDATVKSGCASIATCGVECLKVLSVIRRDLHISTLDIAKVCGISRRSVERAIHNLKENGILRREGSPRYGNWHIDRLPHGFHEDTSGFVEHGGINS